jgi:hypothetical protein
LMVKRYTVEEVALFPAPVPPPPVPNWNPFRSSSYSMSSSVTTASSATSWNATDSIYTQFRAINNGGRTGRR